MYLGPIITFSNLLTRKVWLLVRPTVCALHATIASQIFLLLILNLEKKNLDKYVNNLSLADIENIASMMRKQLPHKLNPVLGPGHSPWSFFTFSLASELNWASRKQWRILCQITLYLTYLWRTFLYGLKTANINQLSGLAAPVKLPLCLILSFFYFIRILILSLSSSLWKTDIFKVDFVSYEDGKKYFCN